MSLFITKLPVDLEAIKRLLPQAQTHIEGVSWNPETKQVELKWSNPNLLTKFTVATEFPIEDLQKQILPKAVWMRERPPLAHVPSQHIPTPMEVMGEAEARRIDAQMTRPPTDRQQKVVDKRRHKKEKSV